MAEYRVYIVIESDNDDDRYDSTETYVLATLSKGLADHIVSLMETCAHEAHAEIEAEVRRQVREELKEKYVMGGRRDLFEAGFAAAKAGEPVDAIPDELLRTEIASWYHGYFNFDYSQDPAGPFTLGEDGYPLKFRNEDEAVARRMVLEDDHIHLEGS